MVSRTDDAEFGDCKNKPLDWCLGLSVVKDPQTNFLGVHQSAYIDFMIERFELEHATTASTPLPPDMNKNKGDRCDDVRFSDSVKLQFFSAVTRVHLRFRTFITKYCLVDKFINEMSMDTVA